MDAIDVVVVGAGNAALCAALSAQEAGARVVVLERAPEGDRGGNSAHSGGAFRTVYDGVEDLRRIVPDLTDSEIAMSDFGTYSRDVYFDDCARLSNFRANMDLLQVLVDQSLATMVWMREKGVRFVPIYGRQAFKLDGKFKFWGGLTVEAVGGGRGLMDMLFASAAKRDIEVIYGARAVGLVSNESGVQGVEIMQGQKRSVLPTKAVVLGSGGFHANAEWRARYLGPDWDLAKPRGTRFNTGDGIRMAIDAGAMSYGHWSGCHAVAYDRCAPEFGDLALAGQQKNGFPMGIMVNLRGERFFNEGADFRNYIYATLGKAVLQQPTGLAWQVFDQRVAHLLSDEYRIRQITKIEADTLEDLVEKMGDVDRDAFLATVRAFNAAVRQDVAFNPNIKDGRGTVGLAVPKSNWANPLDTPPYIAFGITTGVTCTYGGIRIDETAHVVSEDGPTIPGLFATGELVGGLYYTGYPGGAGLMSGSVFGRLAGAGAARFAAGG
ncbi:tricarballylate dehydrogenase [Humitalea rosea]|uniref:Tricarballylate dehydrogenase n=1 Tax=Humitalea rosea TaxID=990373 RepID=A0A2W7ITR8_9PROT|nr:FAD-dependent tricarballylate dehydrogenase TcuA [Humitalea rosea]PZW50904.1 tricarballylate dehydrogenase [Humitalea rosea]